MAVSMKEVRVALEPDEPNYEQAKRLGPDALPHLKTLIRGPDTMMAAKAASLAGMIGGSAASQALLAAADHSDAGVRQAAAYSAQFMKTADAEPVMLKLLTDRDSMVVKRAAQSSAMVRSPAIEAELRNVASSRRSTFAVDAATKALQAF
jgi:HEAT repeat protein